LQILKREIYAGLTMEIKPPEPVELIISGPEGQEIELDPKKFQQITFDYDETS